MVVDCRYILLDTLYSSFFLRGVASRRGALYLERAPEDDFLQSVFGAFRGRIENKADNGAVSEEARCKSFHAFGDVTVHSFEHVLFNLFFLQND